MAKKALRRLLVAVLALAGLAVVNPSTALAVGCYSSGCDNKGPVANGCTADQRLISNASNPQAQVIFSPACRAIWALSYEKPLPDRSVYIILERGHYDSAVNLVVDKRLQATFSPGETKEWTNMLGANGSWWRAIWYDQVSGERHYSQWVYR
jgi:hypothetical protein